MTWHWLPVPLFSGRVMKRVSMIQHKTGLCAVQALFAAPHNQSYV